MPHSDLHFFFEDTPDLDLDTSKLQEWVHRIAARFHATLGSISYIFCSDPYLLDINRNYLDHDYFTDIITFDNSEESDTIEGDLFISVDRVKDNASQLNVDFHLELRRVMAHGLLHLIGFKDKSEEEITQMRKSEEACLSLWEN